jgi:hypothetical protein
MAFVSYRCTGEPAGYGLPLPGSNLFFGTFRFFGTGGEESRDAPGIRSWIAAVGPDVPGSGDLPEFGAGRIRGVQFPRMADRDVVVGRAVDQEDGRAARA